MQDTRWSKQVERAAIKWDVPPTGFVTPGSGEVAVGCVRAYVVRQFSCRPRISPARHEYSSVVLLGFGQPVDLLVKVDGDELEITVSKPIAGMRRQVAERYEASLRRGMPLTRQPLVDMRA